VYVYIYTHLFTRPAPSKVRPLYEAICTRTRACTAIKIVLSRVRLHGPSGKSSTRFADASSNTLRDVKTWNDHQLIFSFVPEPWTEGMKIVKFGILFRYDKIIFGPSKFRSVFHAINSLTFKFLSLSIFIYIIMRVLFVYNSKGLQMIYVNETGSRSGTFKRFKITVEYASREDEGAEG